MLVIELLSAAILWSSVALVLGSITMLFRQLLDPGPQELGLYLADDLLLLLQECQNIIQHRTEIQSTAPTVPAICTCCLLCCCQGSVCAYHGCTKQLGANIRQIGFVCNVHTLIQGVADDHTSIRTAYYHTPRAARQHKAAGRAEIQRRIQMEQGSWERRPWLFTHSQSLEATVVTAARIGVPPGQE